MRDPQRIKETQEERINRLREALETAERMTRSGTEPALIIEHMTRALASDDRMVGETAAAIELRDSGFDFRDYLEDTAIHNGDQLHLWLDDHWVNVRYELAHRQEREVVLVGEGTTWRLNRSTMRFRWPPRT